MLAGALLLGAVVVSGATLYIALGPHPGNSSTSGGPPGSSPRTDPGPTPTPTPSPTPTPFPSFTCRGSAACFSGKVAHIVDGDTLDVDTTRIRLALVNSPEAGEAGYSEAKQFTGSTCPVGSTAIVDQDDGQTGGSYGRMVAVVYCGSTNLNAALLTSGHAVLVPYYCSVSEFSNESWSGCG